MDGIHLGSYIQAQHHSQHHSSMTVDKPSRARNTFEGRSGTNAQDVAPDKTNVVLSKDDRPRSMPYGALLAAAFVAFASAGVAFPEFSAGVLYGMTFGLTDMRPRSFQLSFQFTVTSQPAALRQKRDALSKTITTLMRQDAWQGSTSLQFIDPVTGSELAEHPADAPVQEIIVRYIVAFRDAAAADQGKMDLDAKLHTLRHMVEVSSIHTSTHVVQYKLSIETKPEALFQNQDALKDSFVDLVGESTWRDQTSLQLIDQNSGKETAELALDGRSTTEMLLKFEVAFEDEAAADAAERLLNAIPDFRSRLITRLKTTLEY